MGILSFLWVIQYLYHQPYKHFETIYILHLELFVAPSPPGSARRRPGKSQTVVGCLPPCVGVGGPILVGLVGFRVLSLGFRVQV